MARRAYTLLELLVSIAIIAVLIALTLPAVQKVRASAAKADCANRLRQIGLAAAMHHDRDGRLPMGYEPFGKKSGHPGMGWLAKLLPDLEQSALWARAETDYAANRNPFRGTPPHANRDTVVPAFGCPADGRVATAWTVTLFDTAEKYAFSSYLGCLGTNYRLRDGVLYRDSRTKYTDILDGTSNTILAAERPPSPDMIYGWWYAGTGQAQSGSLDAVIGTRELNRAYPWYAGCGKGPFHFRDGDEEDFCSAFHFWSPHGDGANFAFADGSVRFLRYGADSVIPALGTRAGNEVAPIPD